MGLDQLCAEIDSRSQAQAAALIKTAHDDARRIGEEARAAAERTLASARREAEEFAAAEGRTRLTACQLEASRHLVEAREEAVRQSLQQVWEYYRLLPKRAGYAARLKAWAQKALDELQQPNAVLRANENDGELLRGAGFKVSKSPLECAGGVRAETPDGRIAVDSTLEAQFERKREDLVQRIHQKLFSAQDTTMLDIPKEGDGEGRRGAKELRRGPKRTATRPAARRAVRRNRASAKAVRSLASSSMMAMPVSSRSGGRWRSRA